MGVAKGGHVWALLVLAAGCGGGAGGTASGDSGGHVATGGTSGMAGHAAGGASGMIGQGGPVGGVGSGGAAGQSGAGGGQGGVAGQGGATGAAGRGGAAGTTAQGGIGGGPGGTGGGQGGKAGGQGGKGGAFGGMSGQAGSAGAGGAGTTTTQACQVLGLSFPHEISVSGDGSLVAVAGHGGLVNVFTGSDGTHVKTLVAPGVVLIAAALSPDGTAVVAGGRDGSLRRWRLSDGTLSWTVAAHAAQVASVRFSPDGATLASISTNGTGRLSRASDGGLIAPFTQYDSGNSVAFSPDGQWLASGAEYHASSGIITGASQVSIWRASDAAFVRSLQFSGSLGGPAVAFSPDSQTLAIAVGSVFKTVHVSDGTDATTFTGYPNGPTRVAFTPDGATLVANGAGATSIWSVTSGTLVRQITYPNDDLVEGLAVMPDGMRVVSGVNAVDVQDVQVNRIADGAEVWSVPGFDDVSSLSYSATGMLASGSFDTLVHLWNADGTQSRAISGGAIPSIGAFFGDGSSLVVSGNGLFVVGTSDGQIQAQTHDESGLIATSASGNLLAIDTYPKTLALRALPALTAGQTFTESNTVDAMTLSADGTLLASGDQNGQIVVRQLGTDAGVPLSFMGHTGGTFALAFSPDGAILASAGADGAVRLWQMPQGTPGFVLGGGTDQIYSLAFSPDGAGVAAGFNSGVVRTWRVADGSLKTSFVGHASGVDALAYSADGTRLASGGSDATIRIWCSP